MSSKLLLLRKEIIDNKLDGFIIPSCDEFLSEYAPEFCKRLEYLTGFTGSNGIGLILIDKAILFTDGRYLIQAKLEIDSYYQIIDLGKENLNEWIKNNLTKNNTIGYDPKLHKENFVKTCSNYCNLIPVENLVDKIWYDKPLKPKSKIIGHPLEYSGKLAEDKLQAIHNYILQNNLNALIITDPASICWLLNIRGNDIKYNPVVLSYLIIHDTEEIVLVTDSEDEIKLVKVKIVDFAEFENYLNFSEKKVQIDSSNCNYYIIDQLNKNNATIINLPDPCILEKACKNSVEIENAKKAYIKDGIAICKFLFWLEQNPDNNTELSLIAKLEDFRKEDAEYLSPSFETICGYKSNGAITHYRANNDTNKKIEGNGLLLIDSGAQYRLGTTDVTRTIAIGAPAAEEKENFTRVLKGHILLAGCKFPKNTSGYQLDSIARYHLWQSGLDYAHGTGHGVGSYLSVHEGPQGISKHPNSTKLLPGMILSNEPGYYKENHYGIRIENLIYINNSKYDDFLEFENLTLVPIDYKLIEPSLLSIDEKKYLLDYHKNLLNTLSVYISDSKIIKWLEEYVEYYQFVVNTY